MKPARAFVISDLHIGHDNLCKKIRGMSSEECDALIIKNWNSIVKEQDKVFILGDITMDNPKYINKLLLLKGRKVIIGGNHDTVRCCEAIKKLELAEKRRMRRELKKMEDMGEVNELEKIKRLEEIKKYMIPLVGCVEYNKYLLTHIPVHPTQLDGVKANVHGHIHRRDGDKIMNHARMTIDDPRYYNVNCELHDYTPVLFDKIIREIEKAKSLNKYDYDGCYDILDQSARC